MHTAVFNVEKVEEKYRVPAIAAVITTLVYAGVCTDHSYHGTPQYFINCASVLTGFFKIIYLSRKISLYPSPI